jgi:heme/copper-type cytochrome/quinol oxidase subunit 2
VKLREFGMLKGSNAMHFGKVRSSSIGLLVTLFLFSQSALGQCAMCKAAVEGDPQAKAASDQLDLAVLTLLIPPVLIFIGFFVLIYRFRRHFRSPERQASDLDRILG